MIQGEPALRVVAIGCSTGGPDALAEVLKGVPSDCPAAVLIAQHMEEGFTAGLAGWLDARTNMRVVEGRTGDMIVPGVAYVARGGSHMRVTSRRCIEITRDPADPPHRPSVDELFRSVARVYGRDAVGVVLTGMGSDGAEGLAEMSRAGALTIAQDEETSVVYGMPRAAAESRAARMILPLSSVARQMLSRCGVLHD